MSDEIKPALTAEEWADTSVAKETGLGPARVQLRVRARGNTTLETWRMGHACTVHGDLFHATAALCLHGQPFGFTREDVEAVRLYVIGLGDREEWEPERTALTSIAARIEALLPPEEK